MNFSWITEGGSHFSQQALSLSVNREIGRGWSGYVEVYGFSRVTRTEGAGITVNGGVGRQFAGRVQIDVEAGHGLTRRSTGLVRWRRLRAAASVLEAVGL